MQGGKLAEALEILMSLERLCRVGNDFPNLKEVILTAARLCREVKDWAQLNTTLTLLSKRRGQHGKTVTAMVQEVGRACIGYRFLGRTGKGIGEGIGERKGEKGGVGGRGGGGG